MVKSKKMSKTSIAVIVLALLLVLSMVMGITGAWFTAESDKSGVQQTLHFGNVTYTLNAVGATVAHAEGNDTDGYLLVAGSSISTEVKLTNASTVNTYYALYSQKDGKIYVVDEANKKLVEVTAANSATIYASNGLGYMAPALTTGTDEAKAAANERKFSKTYYLANYDNKGTAAAAIFKEDNNDGAVIDITGYDNFKLGEGQNSAATLQWDDLVDLGGALVNGSFQLRAVQAQNVAAADGYAFLLTNWTVTKAIANA